jgi:hypothetical protein
MAVEWKKVAYADDCIAKTVLNATGDLLHRNVAGNPDGLTVVADGHVLTIALESGAGTEVPVWADAASPGAHAASHKSDGVTDVLSLDDLVAEGNVAFAGQEAKDLVVYNKTTPPATPVLGKWYYDTDTDVGLYLCTSITA